MMALPRIELGSHVPGFLRVLAVVVVLAVASLIGRPAGSAGSLAGDPEYAAAHARRHDAAIDYLLLATGNVQGFFEPCG